MAIQRISDFSTLPQDLRGGVVAIGNFDGVHRGHQIVLEKALELAEALGKPAIVLTFEPHPRTVFQPDKPVFRLTPPKLKAQIMSAMGLSAVIEQTFTGDFAAISADAFVHDILVGALGTAHVVTGFDFHFGKNRQGGPAYLMAAGEREGFEVTLVDAFRDEDGSVISSSRIRDSLAASDAVAAAGLLGYRHLAQATVIEGKKLGRTLGYPTANMQLAPETRLAHGIYAVRYRRADGTIRDGVASFGRRPTVTDDGAPLLETFVFDFDGDLYGETCAVSFFGFLRPELKFDGLNALMVQMKRDEEEARTLLTGVRPLSGLDAKVSFS
jgi:riboflavin kinase / FMN adenylyltransferase